MLEEAAYVDPGFFYVSFFSSLSLSLSRGFQQHASSSNTARKKQKQETVAPLLLIGNTSLLAISTLTSGDNFYTRLLRMRDKTTGLPLFTSLSVQLACQKCIDDGKAVGCIHMLHLVPRWQSSDRHVKLKTIMQVLAKMQGRTC